MRCVKMLMVFMCDLNNELNLMSLEHILVKYIDFGRMPPESDRVQLLFAVLMVDGRTLRLVFASSNIRLFLSRINIILLMPLLCWIIWRDDELK